MDEWQIQLLKDSKLIKVLDKQFDEETFVLDILNRSTPSELSEIFTKLSTSKQEIAQSFSNTIKDNYNRLIDDFQNMKDLNFEITDCRVRVQSIQKMLSLINSNFIQNYENIQNKAPTLKNTTEALTLTRAALKFLQNLKKLKSIVGPKLEIYDLSKACIIIKEIIKVISEQNLDGVEFYERERDFIDEVREKIIAINDKKFLESITSKNVVEITHCIQNFYNLRILTERVQTAATSMMKNIFELWKKCINSEYEKPYSGMLVLGNSLKTLLQEQLNYHTQIWLVSTILRKRDSNSLDSFFEYMKEGKIVNLYDEVWKKQIVIMNHHLKHFKEDAKDPNTENNKLLFIRIYPKIHFFFEEFLQNLSLFMLKYPDPHEIKDITTFRESFMEVLAPFSKLYFDFLQSYFDQRFQANIDHIFKADAGYFKNYTGGILSETAKIGQFVNFEVKDNIKTASIFKKFGTITINAIFVNLKTVFSCYDNTDLKKLSLNRIFAVFLYQYELRKIMFTIATQKFNEELEIQKIDEIINLCEKYEKGFLEVIFQTLFDNTYSIIKQIYNHYKQEILVKSNNHHTQLDTLYEFLLNYSVTFNQKLEGCIPFVEHWNKFLFTILSLLALVFSSFSEKNDRLIEMMNKDVENMGYIIDSIHKKDVLQRLLLINIQKLMLIDSNSMKQFVENRHEILKNVPKTLLAFNFLKRTEREGNTSLIQIKGRDEEKGLDDILTTYFEHDGDKEKGYTLERLYKAFNNFDSIREDSLLVIQRISEREGFSKDRIPSLEVLSMLIE